VAVHDSRDRAIARVPRFPVTISSHPARRADAPPARRRGHALEVDAVLRELEADPRQGLSPQEGGPASGQLRPERAHARGEGIALALFFGRFKERP
jgi:hypothetical protein